MLYTELAKKKKEKFEWKQSRPVLKTYYVIHIVQLSKCTKTWLSQNSDIDVNPESHL
jgi:hypothetical protein